MKLADYARQMGVRYETAWRWFRDGKIQCRAIEVVNQAETGTEDLLADLSAILYSFCARLYGQRRAKRKTEVLVRELEAKGDKRGGRTGGSRCSWLSAMSSSASSAPIRASR